MKKYIVDVENVSYQSGEKFIVKKVNLKIERKQHYCLFGLNGCGKTTLLSILAGYQSPTEGSVTLMGERFSAQNIRSLRKRIGLVSMSFFERCYTKEAVLDIVLSSISGGLSVDFSVDNATVKKALMLLNQLGIEDKAGSVFSVLSKGERQKVLLARALLTNPEILLFDEPCSGLDVVAREQLLQMIKHICEQTDATVIYVTHHVEEILPVFQHTVLMKNGEIVLDGATDQLFTTECIRELIQYPVLINWTAEGRITLSVDAAAPIGGITNDYATRRFTGNV